MESKIPKHFSIPLRFSANWSDVTAISFDNDELKICLNSGQEVFFKDLDLKTVDNIFKQHSKYISSLENQEASEKQTPQKKSNEAPSPTEQTNQDHTFEVLQKGLKEVVSMTMKLGGSAIGELGAILEHNPAHAELPPLPQDMAERMKVLSNIIPKEDLEAMNPPIEGCNCLYCQIQRIIRNESSKTFETSPHEEDAVDDKELEFSEWQVTSIGDKLYSVVNKLDTNEEYRVFLGEPMGCTCGRPHCEHIVAVLRS